MTALSFDSNALPSAVPKAKPNQIANWLFSVALLVFVMVVVGGITRLTESGLSITEWKPISGALPPLNEAAWAVEFEKYKAIPEYQLENGPAGMTLASFKFIYFWEWIHRLLGRLIGVAFAVPLLWFWVRGVIPATYKVRLLPLLALGALQGTIGWWMVSSGLTQRTDVSHFRLAVHLIMALTIMAGLIWTALDLRALSQNNFARPARLNGFSAGVIVILFVQLLFGAWVAGMRAGHVSNTWPLMNDHFVPQGIDWANGAINAFANDPYLVHFVHRWWAWMLVLALVLLARRVKKTGARRVSIAIHSAFGTQILLGIATVFSGVHITLAVLHQAVGALVVASIIWGAHVLGRDSLPTSKT